MESMEQILSIEIAKNWKESMSLHAELERLLQYRKKYAQALDSNNEKTEHILSLIKTINKDICNLLAIPN